MTEDQRALYLNAGVARSAELTSLWYMAQVFIAVHAVILTLAVTLIAAGRPLPLGVVVGGVVAGVHWFIMTRQHQRRLSYWNGRQEIFEMLEPQEVRVFGGPRYEVIENQIVINNILIWLIGLVTMVWSFVLFDAVYRIMIK